jgi:hypothetical protein
MDKKTVRSNLEFLVSQGLIKQEKRSGLTNVYGLNPPSNWKPNPTQNTVGVDATPPKRQEPTPPNPRQATPPKRQEGNPTQNTVGKGSPIEGNPMKVLPSKNKERGARHNNGPAFSPPTVEQAKAYAMTIDLSPIEAEAFCDHGISIGWRVGKHPMKDWKGAMRTWKHRSIVYSRNGTPNQAKPDQTKGGWK